jgi:hypothetical protein
VSGTGRGFGSAPLKKHKRCVPFATRKSYMDILEDNKFFQRLGLTRDFELRLNCSSEDFRELFENNMGNDNSFKDIYFSKKEFKGSIRRHTFDMHKSLNFGDNSMSIYGAKGTYNETENGLLLNVTVYIPIWILTFIYTMILLWNIILIVLLFTSAGQYFWTIGTISTGLLLITILYPYFTFKNGVNRLTRELEREFIYWTT